MTLKLSSLLLLLLASAVMGSGVGYSKLYLFHLMLILFVLEFFYYVSFNRRQTTLYNPKNHFIYFLYFMFSWYAMSILWSIEPLYTLRYLFYLIIGTSIVYVINSYISDTSRYSSVFKMLSVFFILAIVVALLEAFTPFRLPTSPYSDYAALFGRKAADFMKFESSAEALIKSAPTAFWGNPNNLAVSMTLILPFFLMHKNILVKTIGVVSILLIIAMAGSRGAFLGFLFGIGVFFFIRGVHYWLPILILDSLSLGMLINNIETLKQSDNKRISELAWTEMFFIPMYLKKKNP